MLGTYQSSGIAADADASRCGGSPPVARQMIRCP